MKRHSLKVNAIFNALYQVLILIVPLITTPYISRVLGPDANGIYANFYSFVQYFVLVASFGFVDFGTKKIAESRDNPSELTKNFLLVSINKGIFGLSCLIIYIGTVFILFPNNSLFALIFSFYIISVILDPVFYFNGQERFITICIRNIILKTVSTVLIFLLVKGPEDLSLYTLILALSQLFSILIMIPSIEFKKFVKVKITFKDLADNFKKSFSYFVPALAVSLFTFLNQSILGFFGKDDAESGYYAQTVKIIQVLTSLSASIGIIMLSRMSYLNSANNEEEAERKIKQSFQAFWVLSLPLTFGICAINSKFIPVFLGEGYERCILLTYVLSPTIIIGPLNGLYGSIYFRPKDKIRIHTLITLCAALINVVLSIVMVPFYGALGTTIGRLFAELLQLPFLVFFARKYIDIKIPFKTIIKPLISSSLMFIAVYLYNCYGFQLIDDVYINLFIMILMGVLIYGALEIALKDEIVYSNVKIIFSKIFRRKNKQEI